MEVVILAVVTAALACVAYVFGRSYRQRKKLIRLIQQQKEPLLYCDAPWSNLYFQVVTPGDRAPAVSKSGLLAVTEKRLSVYQSGAATLIAEFACAPGEIRGFWRPQKYDDGINELWIHIQMGGLWCILKLRLMRHDMQALIRAMKVITTEEQVKAYRRQRPYIHRAPTPACPAVQNLQGAWELDAPVDLYLMPLYLVIFHQGQVQRLIDLHHLQQIAALPRLDAPQSDGLLRFRVETTGEMLAFALKEYEAWADDLAQAAKRTLEEPVMRKQKGYEEE